MSLTKVFTGNEIMALAAQARLDEAGINSLVKNNIPGGTLTGQNPAGLSVEVFVEVEDVAKAEEVIKKL